MGSSGGSTPQTTTQQSSPWSGVQPFLSGTYGAADALRTGDVGYQPYTGQTQAPMSPDLNNSLGWQRDVIEGRLNTGTPGIEYGRQLGANMITNQGLSPELKSLYQQAQGDQNPYLNSMIDASNRRIGDKVNSSMSGAGRYGSGAHTDVATRAMAEAADPLLAQDYARRQQQMRGIAEGGLQRAGQWAELMPTLDDARFAGLDRLQGIGQFLSNRDQLALQDQIKLYNAQQARPWEQLSREAGILSGAGSLGGTSVTTSNPYQPSMLQRGFGGAAAGAGLGASFGGLPGAGIGAVGGGLLGMLG